MRSRDRRNARWQGTVMVCFSSALLFAALPACLGDADSQPSERVTAALTSADAVPLYRYWNGRYHFYSTNGAESGVGSLERVAGDLFSTQADGSTPLYRYAYVNGGTCAGAHFYTTNLSELGAGANGWVSNGIVGYVPTSGAGTVSLYRYFNPGSCDHFYTVDFQELGGGGQGYQYEGIQSLIFAPPAPPAPAACTPRTIKTCCAFPSGCSCVGRTICNASGAWGSCIGSSPRGQTCQAE